MLENKNTEIPIEINPSDLSEGALNGIIENFVLREGTDYGAAEVAYETKLNQIKRQIEKGFIKIVFDQKAETVTLISDHDFKKRFSAIQSQQDCT
jgi:uncharacterized protein YheU (UPF0270 family)